MSTAPSPSAARMISLASPASEPPLYRPRTSTRPSSRPDAAVAAASRRSGSRRTSPIPVSPGTPWPLDRATATDAAASNVPAGTAPPSAIRVASPPRKLTTTGLPAVAAARRTTSATASDGGLEMSTMTSVPGSAESRASPSSIIEPPTRSCRSRPPTPMACETPAPSRSMRTLTCWSPVPDAATRPIRPRRTTLANPSGTPSRMAVPQSGPMTISPDRRPRALSSISSSIVTLSLNRKTWSPRLRAFMASAAA